MTIGPRDKPYPIILHVDSNTGNPVKLAESSAIFVSSVSAITLSATTVCATNWVNLPNIGGVTDHGALTGLSDNDHPQYVLSATNTALSSLVENLQTSAGQLSSTISSHLASAVHWDANTLDARFINASGDSVTGAFTFGSVSAANISATNAYIASTILFNTQVAPTLAVGQIGWNSTDQTIDIQTTVDTTLQVGQEQVMLVENKSGAAIENGKVVYVSGTTGGSGKLNVGLASASSVNSETAFIIGVATQTINDNSTGFVTTFGKVNGIPLPTASFSDGDIVYLGDTPGEIRNYKPSKPSHGSFQLGRVIRAHNSNGILFVTIRGSVDMSEIHDVASSIPSNGQVLVWNNASGLYEPKNVNAISGIDNYATTASLNNYVLTSVNTNLSSLVTNLQTSTASISSTVSNHIASAVHWDANTLDARFVNASGDSVTGSFFYGNLSATNFSATTYLNLPSVTALNGTGVFELTSYSRSNYVLTSTNLALSNAVTGHLASAVHWDANTLDARFINASGDSVTGSFTFGSVTGTNISATTYLNLPSVTALNGTGVFEVTSYSRSNYVLTSTNLELSNTVTGHLASAVHWDANTLDARFINASGDSVTGAFTFGSVTATTFSATNYSNLPSITALNGTGIFEVTSYSRSNYVLTSTNLELSNTVTGHLASAVHWDANTLDARFINASGDSVTGAFTFGSVTATTFSATTYSNLPSVTSLNGTGIFEVTSYSRSNYVLTSTNLELSNTVTGHLASAVHWDANTLDARFINASGDSVTGAFTFGSVTATTFSATNYSGISLSSSLRDVQITATPTTNYVLKWNGSKWAPAPDQTGGGGGTPTGGQYAIQVEDGAGGFYGDSTVTYDYDAAKVFISTSNLQVDAVATFNNSTDFTQPVTFTTIKGNLVSSTTVSAATVSAATSMTIGSVALTPSNNSTIRVASSILIPSAIFFGSAIPSTATQIAGIYYTGQSAQNAPPAIYQCNQDNLNIYTNYSQGKAIRFVDQITPAGGFGGSGYEFDGNSFIIQHGTNASASLEVRSMGVLTVASALSATNVSATNLQQLIAASAAMVSSAVNTNTAPGTVIFNRTIPNVEVGDILDIDINGTLYVSGAVATVTPTVVFQLGSMSATLADGTTVASGALTQTSYKIGGSYSVNSTTGCALNMFMYRGVPALNSAGVSLTTNTSRQLWATSSVSVTGSRDFTFYVRSSSIVTNQQFVLHNYKVIKTKSL